MKISVVGTGYVGLVSGVCLADKGHEVICIDVDPAKISMISQGKPPIYEKGLESLLGEMIGKRLSVTDDLHEAVQSTDLTLIAVGTPFDGREIDLTYVEQAAAQIGRAIANKSSYHVVVVKSTVVPGTTDGLVLKTLELHSGKKAGADFGVGMNPEFLTEGVAIRDFMNPDRIVIGGIDQRSRDVLRDVYAGFPDTPILETNTRTAELIKYASNALLATMISFSNEIANLASAIGGIDSLEVMHGVHLSEYLSVRGGSAPGKAKITSFLSPGCGFGGSCLPKDVKALTAQGKQHGLPMGLLEQVIRINTAQPEMMLNMLARIIPELKGKTIGLLGLAFKEGTDDMRESPAIPIARELLKRGADVVAYDPIAMAAAKALLPGDITYAQGLRELISSSDALMLVTRWDEFQTVPDLMRELGRDDLPFIDGRRFIDKHALRNYAGIGLS